MSTAMKTYVLGFIFSHDLKTVVLIRKEPQRSEQQWQKGLLNGIGGGIEPEDDSPPFAMIRECTEETGLIINSWNHFATMGDELRENWMVWCYAIRVADIYEAKTVEREQVSLCDVAEILAGDHETIENVPWLIALAIDHLQDGRPKHVEVSYP